MREPPGSSARSASSTSSVDRRRARCALAGTAKPSGRGPSNRSVHSSSAASPRSRTSATIGAATAIASSSPRAPHGTSLSMGTTRIDVAPASRSAGSSDQTSSAATAACTAIVPSSREREHGGRAHAREHVADRRQRLGRRVHHHVAPASRGDDAGEHQLEPLDQLVLLLDRRATADQDGLRREKRPDQPQSVRARRRAGRDEIDDRVGEPEARRRLDRAGDRHELGVDAALVEQQPRRDRIGGRDAEAAEVGDLGLGRVVRHRRLQRAAREPELREREDVGPAPRRRGSPRSRRGATTPSWTYSGMSLGRTSRRSTGAFAHGTTSERSVVSNESPASAQQPQRRLGHAALGRHGHGEPAVLSGTGEARSSPLRPLECDPVAARSVPAPTAPRASRWRSTSAPVPRSRDTARPRRGAALSATGARAPRARRVYRDRGESGSPRRSCGACGSWQRARRYRRRVERPLRRSRLEPERRSVVVLAIALMIA